MGHLTPIYPPRTVPLRLVLTVSATHHRIMLLAGYNFVVFHFGNGAAGGSPGGWWQAWHLNGFGGTFTVPTVGRAPVGGFSSARYYNPVPDGGATLILLGAAFGVIAAVRRKFVA